MLIKTKQIVYKGKKFRAFKIISKEFLYKLNKTVETQKNQYCLIYNDKINYIFDNFFVWRKTNEYIYLYQSSLIKTDKFVGNNLKKKDLLKWKNKIFGEKNEGRKQTSFIQSFKKNGVSNKSKTKNTNGKSKSISKLTKKV
ncbi:hypothetical protein LCGC14_2044600 [marine sediment metagenome]|uniref:Uncharacterized protein n=1 Tax=marine sediment metagenome TaxID=412755 RepID=A0A0F9EQZ3_9ZZZZ